MANICKRISSNGLARLYLVSISALLFLTMALVMRYVGVCDGGYFLAMSTALCLALLLSHPVVSITNSLLRMIVKPEPLPVLDGANGVAIENTTLVVIPDLLLSGDKIDSLLNNLRDHFVLNDDPNIFFGVLTDWGDSADKHQPSDDEKLAAVIDRIRSLNSTYGFTGRQPFFLLHRERKWNARDKLWMGYERKRGKLEDLNALILHGDTSLFICVEGDLSAVARARYVLTLDNDTLLPAGAALKLISTIAHPDNAPVFDETKGIVAGHAILQPRMMATEPTEVSSWFERFWVRQRGNNPNRPQFDIFQDLFREGCFTGVGIYSVADFDRALRDMIPENHLLSHDIVEGCFARAGRAGAVHLFESVPPTFHAASRRSHRWTRGDWQNSSWLFPLVPSAKGRRANTFSLLSQWKILKCMITSLFSLSFMALPFLCAMTDHVFNAIVVGLTAVILPIAVDLLVKRLLGLTVSSVRMLKDCSAYAFMLVSFAPFEGIRNLDAAIRALYRVNISRRRGLEWVPSSAYEGDDIGLMGYVRYMWIAPAAAAVLTIWVQYWAARWSAPLVVLICAWVMAPVVAWFISKRQAGLAVTSVASNTEGEIAH